MRATDMSRYWRLVHIEDSSLITGTFAVMKSHDRKSAVVSPYSVTLWYEPEHLSGIVLKPYEVTVKIADGQVKWASLRSMNENTQAMLEDNEEHVKAAVLAAFEAFKDDV